MRYEKILKGAAIAGAAAFLTVVAEALPGIDFGVYTPIVFAGASAIINTIREYLKTL